MKTIFLALVLGLAIGGDAGAAQFSRPYFERDTGPSVRIEPTLAATVEKPAPPQTSVVKKLKIRGFYEPAPMPILSPAFQAGPPPRIALMLPPRPPVVTSPLLLGPPPSVSRELPMSREAAALPPPLPEVIVAGTARLVYPGRRAPATQEPVIVGEGRVTIRNTTTAAFHLALARDGVALIEFPASDGFAIVHPGNPDLVTIDEASRQPHAPLILRPGSGFVSGPTPAPTALVVAQMRSGLICSLFIHPAPNVNQNANVIHVAYDPAEIAEVRRKAGFAAEIKEIRDTPEKKPALTEPAPEPKRVRSVAVPPDPLEKLLRENRFANASPNAPRALRNGLELSVADGPSLDDRTGTFIVRVRNASAWELRLIDTQPALAVRTFGPRGELIQEEALTELKRVSEKATSAIAPGETRVFAVSFRIPVLGVRQRLAVSIAHATAADEPVAVVIGGPVNEKKNEKKGKD